MRKDHPWNKAIKESVAKRPGGGAEKRLKAAIAGKVPARKKKLKTKWVTEVDGDWQD